MSTTPGAVQDSPLTSHDAIDLLDYRRFDIPAKTLCARFLGGHLDSNWGVRVYQHHLEVWNGLHELSPVKKGLDAYLAPYRQMLADVKNDAFDFDRAPVLLNSQQAVINGSHRLAAAIFHNKHVKAQVVSDDRGQICPYAYLRSRTKFVPTGLREEFADAMACEYIRLKSDRANLFIVMIFPAAQGREQSVHEILDEHSQTIYEKHTHFTSNGAVNLMRQIYWDEPWLGSITDGFPGAMSKASYCFTKKGPVRVYLVESSSLDEINIVKRKIRDLYRLENHSVHINDTNEEAASLANIFFNRNTINFMNFGTLQPGFQTFNRLFTQFKEWTRAEGINTEDICIDASSTLSAYGLREGLDIDFLHPPDFQLRNLPADVNSHNDWAHHYQQTIDDIIYNPINHFYYDDIKFTTPAVVKDMKLRRGEEKDARDVHLIEQLESGTIAPRVKLKKRSRARRFLRNLRHSLRARRRK